MNAAENPLLTTLVPVVIAIFIHLDTNWLGMFLFLSSGFYVFWRRSGKHKSVRFWQGAEAQWEPSDLFTETTPIKHLPAWQQELIQEHRVNRSSVNVKPSELIWTRGADGALVTELAFFWSHVVLAQNGQIGYTVYSKKSGVVAHFWIDGQSEQEAMNRALVWMRRGAVAISAD